MELWIRTTICCIIVSLYVVQLILCTECSISKCLCAAICVVDASLAQNGLAQHAKLDGPVGRRIRRSSVKTSFQNNFVQFMEPPGRSKRKNHLWRTSSLMMRYINFFPYDRTGDRINFFDIKAAKDAKTWITAKKHQHFSVLLPRLNHVAELRKPSKRKTTFLFVGSAQKNCFRSYHSCTVLSGAAYGAFSPGLCKAMVTFVKKSTADLKI